MRDEEVKRFKAKNINRNGKALIGRRADVYVNETYYNYTKATWIGDWILVR